MEPAAQLVVDPAQGHLLQGHRSRLPRRLVARASGHIEQQIDGGGMGKLGLRTEAPMVAIELIQCRRHHLVHDAHAQIARVPGKVLVVLDRFHHAARRLQHLVAARLPRIHHGAQHALESRPAVALVPGKIGSPKKRFAIGSKHRGQRPSVLPADSRDRGLVARIHIRTLVAVDLDRDKVLVNHFGKLWILITLPIHHMAPVAPYCADIEQDGLVFSGGTGKGFCSPFVPLDRLVHGGPQVRG